MKRVWSEQSRLGAVKSGSLSVNGTYMLGKIFEGTYYSPKPGDNYVLFEDLQGKIENTQHAILSNSECQNLKNGEKIQIRITYIFNGGGMNAEVIQ